MTPVDHPSSVPAGAVDAEEAVPSPVASSSPGAATGSRVLIVDDDASVVEVLRVHLEDAGYHDLVTTQDSTRAMDLIRVTRPDVVLTDLVMPAMSGFELLSSIRCDSRVHAHLPVIMLTSSADSETKLTALELGATDFLAKPVDPSELVLRLRNTLARKAYQDQLEVARSESDRLLYSILPLPVAERLKRGEPGVADHFDSVTVLFADLVDFTRFASTTDASTVVTQLNRIFSQFDQIVAQRRLEKIKTIGDAYMLAGGIPSATADHAAAVVDAAIAMRMALERLRARGEVDFSLRIGIHTGPVVAGVIGTSKFSYDLWGDTVNIASRMESHGSPDEIQISEATLRAMGDGFEVAKRGWIEIKGMQSMRTYLVKGHAR